ncbi:YtnP family quorum-quenching lactonase [Bacillus atrophaeus]|uniref:YtnP family quorum-quenching lactonase n=1 Tax=Bacillus atrophaeus TaxID=1452 RepID=UPI001C62BEB5|nr:MBL fold metallo-hydrolase [Bacillus atrophaeus]MEC0766061.1 MBL fold metallo-hydrolase [Bacillus atrophaeus]MEC0778606.1 MBL fold metallo-hydrolase [Bacillus atrophaeus]MEC0808642.1 MBL fold metallo-hydrolase [Bacillus atrophaeus]MED4803953.1 MBL fold metallo-hydrolase [Bacillus atrophaeus]MED4815615.1 MBL fold metallo-hydrolase [Bacillus atrophaeus]
METMKMGSIVFTWLDGGVTHMDGGAMFGVVPKPLWSKKYPVNEKNQIELRTDPILIQKNGLNILVDAGIGSGKMTDKQIRNYGVTQQSNIKKSLAELGLTVHDIDIIAMTHLHFDHASGLTEYQGEKLVSVFPDADIYTSSVEWNEMRHPNIRSKNTYWKENWEAVEGQVKTFNGSCMITEGITMHHTGGHSDGHSILVCEDGDETAIHMADLMPTAAHRNALWVLAYDDYPMTTISEKQKWLAYAEEKDAWMIFYHDECYRAVKWEEDGTITDSLKRTGK